VFISREDCDLTFQRVANKKDLKGGLLSVDVEGKPIVLAMVQVKVFAIDAVCSHEGGPPGVLNAMQNLLRNELGTPEEGIRVEEFTGY
jgi:nitrite reductase/ring-hydroxylating ferredoxin subunit